MRYALLDFIRALAALVIVVFHLGFHLGNKLGSAITSHILVIPGIYKIDLGGLAVSIFIILSGLVLALEYKEKRLNFSSFIAKRFLRIYSVYLLIFFFALILFIVINPGYKIKIGEFLGALSGFGAFFGFWYPSHPYSFYNIINPSWFIGLILVLYLFFPVLMNFLRKYRHYGLFLLFSLSFCSLIVTFFIFGNDRVITQWFPINRVFEFGLGIYLGLTANASVWRVMNSRSKCNGFINFAGEISFPLFLVHQPLLFTCFDLLRMVGVNAIVAVILYLAVSVWASWFFLYLSKMILAKVNYYSRI